MYDIAPWGFSDLFTRPTRKTKPREVPPLPPAPAQPAQPLPRLPVLPPPPRRRRPPSPIPPRPRRQIPVVRKKSSSPSPWIPPRRRISSPEEPTPEWRTNRSRRARCFAFTRFSWIGEGSLRSGWESGAGWNCGMRKRGNFGREGSVNCDLTGKGCEVWGAVDGQWCGR
jgi:hypothetical protein